MVSIKPLNPWNLFCESIDVVLITGRRTLMRKLVHLLKSKLWKNFFCNIFLRILSLQLTVVHSKENLQPQFREYLLKKYWKNNSENNFQFLWAPAEPQVHSSLSSVAQFWQAALVGRERLVGGDVGHLLLLAVHHLHLHHRLRRSAACARQTQVGLYFQPSPPVQELLLTWVRMGKDERKRERNHYQKQKRPRHRMF